MLAPGLGLAGIIRTVAEGYADRPAFGQRATRLDTAADGRGQVLEILPRFDMVTYGQLWQQARGLAAALASDGLHEGDRVAVLGFCSVEYTAVEMAIASLGCASVPLHAGAPVGVLAEMVEEAEPRVIACSTAYLDAGVRLALGAASLARLIVFDYRPDLNDHTATLERGRARIGEARSSVALETFTEVVERAQGFGAACSSHFGRQGGRQRSSTRRAAAVTPKGRCRPRASRAGYGRRPRGRWPNGISHPDDLPELPADEPHRGAACSSRPWVPAALHIPPERPTSQRCSRTFRWSGPRS